MFAYVSKYVLTCPDCQTRKPPPGKPVGFLQPIPPVGRPFEQIGMDFLGPFVKSKRGHRYVLVMTDYHSKWVEAVACPAATAAEAAQAFVEQVVLRHGAPAKIITDRGKHFISTFIEEVFRAMGSNHVTTTAYHPQTNGLCERFNRTLADMLSMYVSTDHRDWDEFLPYVVFGYNSSQHETTGFTPFFLLHGREPTLPIDASLNLQRDNEGAFNAYAVARRLRQARELVAQRERDQQTKNKRAYDARRRGAVFRPGQFVYVWTPSRARGKTTKLLHRYHGPFRLLRQVAENNWEVVDRSGRKRDIVNVARLKLCRPRSCLDDDADDESESERECSVRVDTTVPQRGAAVPPASDHGQSEHSTSDTEVYFDPRTQYRDQSSDTEPKRLGAYDSDTEIYYTASDVE